MVILLQCLKICDFVHRNQLAVSMSDTFTWSHHDWENTLLSVFHTKISLKRRWLDSQNWVLNHWHESWCALMTWTSNDDDLTSDDLESNWWLLVNRWVRMMTSKNDGHISPEWCPWVMSRILGEMMKTTWCEPWLQTHQFLIVSENWERRCANKNKALHKYFDHFSNMHFCNSEISSPLLFPKTLGLKSFVCTAQIKVAEKFHFSLAEEKKKLCYLAGAVTPLKRFNKFDLFRITADEKRLTQMLKKSRFQIKQLSTCFEKITKNPNIGDDIFTNVRDFCN